MFVSAQPEALILLIPPVYRRAIEVDVITLDSLGLSPDSIKIDTEGGEPAVISGGMETISDNLPTLHLEVDPDKWRKPVSEVIEPLIDMKYKFNHVYTGEQLSLPVISDGTRRNVIGIPDQHN